MYSDRRCSFNCDTAFTRCSPHSAPSDKHGVAAIRRFQRLPEAVARARREWMFALSPESVAKHLGDENAPATRRRSRRRRRGVGSDDDGAEVATTSGGESMASGDAGDEAVADAGGQGGARPAGAEQAGCDTAGARDERRVEGATE